MFTKTRNRSDSDTIELVKDFNISNKQVKCLVSKSKERKQTEKEIKKNFKNLNTVSLIIRFLV